MTTRTMVTTRPEVFLSFAMSDREMADEVASDLSRAGLDVVRVDELGTGSEYTDTVRSALRRSAAMVVVLSDASSAHDIPAGILFEIGAAAGAGKPIYVIVQKSTAKLPFSVPNLQVLPITRLDEVARQLSQAA
ncbi:MAG TPA: toll/interleukin-1 receptor domain-containing protein [Tepidisphaeraceae bacterium]|nr:toll/interleukin-1 receptor domain-containing protein [Tepidisphaeraceae bacterium]